MAIGACATLFIEPAAAVLVRFELVGDKRDPEETGWFVLLLVVDDLGREDDEAILGNVGALFRDELIGPDARFL